jgi:hypothetical protein
MAVFADFLQEWPFDLQKRKMIESNELMIGSWVLVNGVPRQVAYITEKEVGYYRKGNSRMFYERLDKIEPIPIYEMKITELQEAVISLGDSVLCLDMRDITMSVDSIYESEVWTLKNTFGESLILRRNEVHLLQQIVNCLGV